MTPSAQLKTSLFWSCLGLSLASGLASQILLALNPEAFASHWFRNAQALLALHLSTLGFVGLLVLGVLSQFLPMLLGKPLKSSFAAALALGIFYASALLLWCFFAGHRLAWLGAMAGIGLPLSVAAFLALAAKALANGGGHRLTRLTLASSLGYLLFTSILGGLMAQGLLRPPLLSPDPLLLIQLHLHLGLFGFAALMIFGVSYELLPMFGLARNFSMAPAWAALILGHLGIFSLVASVFGSLSVAALSAMIWPWLLAAACLAYAVQVLLIIRSSLRRQNEPGPLHFRAAIILMLAGALWGLRLGPEATTGARAAYVYLLLFGFIGSAIFGQLQKILPLLSWYDRFSPLAGKAKIPSAAELMPPRLPWLVPAFHLPATAFGFAGLALASPSLLRASGLLGCCAFAVMTLLWAASRRLGALP